MNSTKPWADQAGGRASQNPMPGSLGLRAVGNQTKYKLKKMSTGGSAEGRQATPVASKAYVAPDARGGP